MALENTYNCLKFMFKELNPPRISLVDTIEIIGLSRNSLRKMLLYDIKSFTPESILCFPIWKSPLEKPFIEILVNNSTLALETKHVKPRFYSTNFTDAEGEFIQVDCLIVYERISPSIIESSKDRRADDIDYGFIPQYEPEEYLYAPIYLCITSRSSYTDVFRDILKALYLILAHRSKKNPTEKLISSLEFFQCCYFLVTNIIIPPKNMKIQINIKDFLINIPIETDRSLWHNESCIAILMNLIDISIIIKLWETMIMNSSIVLVSSNKNLLFLIIQALRQIIYPETWNLSIIFNTNDLEFAGSPSPIIIGLCNKKVAQEDVIRKNKDMTFFNLDTGSFYYGNPCSLCECNSKIIYNKLLLSKIYYYANKNQTDMYGTEAIEESVENQDYVLFARKLLDVRDAKLRENIFTHLVKRAFFEFFYHLRDYKKYVKCIEATYESIYAEQNRDEYEFNSRKFVNECKRCLKFDCSMPDFWKMVFKSTTFDQFFQFYKRFDDSPMRRFDKIIESGIEFPDDNTFKNIEITFKIDSKGIVDNLVAINQEFQADSLEEKYNKGSFEALAEEVQKKIINYEQSGLKTSLEFLNSSPGEIFCTNLGQDSLFYSETGVIRLSKVLSYPIPLDSFTKFSDMFMQPIKSNTWESILINLLNCLSLKEACWDIKKLYETLIELNNINTDALPYHYAAIIINKYFELNDRKTQTIEITGKLQILIKNCLEYTEKNFSVVRSVLRSSSNEVDQHRNSDILHLWI